MSAAIPTQRRRGSASDTWPRVRLGDVATYVNGYAFKPTDWSSAGRPIIRIQDLTGNSYQMNRYSGNVPEKYEVIKGDVLISWSASLGVYIWDREDAFLNQHIFKVVFDKEDIDKRYFFHQVSLILRKSAFEAHGCTMKHLTKPVFDALQFVLPPLAIQRRIAAKLDLLCDIVAKRKNQLSQLNQLVKSRFVEMFGDMPNSTKMAEVCSLITDGTHQSPKFVESGIPFLFVSNVVSNRLTYDAEKFIDEATYEELIKRTPIEIGDVLLSTVGSYGHPAIVNSDRRFLFQRHIAYLKPRKEIVDSQFLHGAILSASVQEQIERKVKGIAQKTLNLSEIKTIMVPLPPLVLQREFAAFVAKVDKLAFAARRRRDVAKQLYRAKIQEYFG